MEKETAGLITAKLLETLGELGVDANELGYRLAEHITGKSLTKAEQALIARSFRETLTDLFPVEKYREPSQQELAQILIKLKTAAPELRKLLMEAARKLPTKAGGRPRQLAKNNAEARLCTFISQQLADGIEKPEAIQTAAIRFGVSYWTVKRAWKRYQEAAKGKMGSSKKKM